MVWRIGRRKAAVLPEPVWAQPMRSLLAFTIGMAYFWMGVGFLYPDLSMFSRRMSRRLASLKVSIFFGGFSPEILAPILSKLQGEYMTGNYCNGINLRVIVYIYISWSYLPIKIDSRSNSRLEELFLLHFLGDVDLGGCAILLNIFHF